MRVPTWQLRSLLRWQCLCQVLAPTQQDSFIAKAPKAVQPMCHACPVQHSYWATRAAGQPASRVHVCQTSWTCCLHLPLQPVQWSCAALPVQHSC